MIDQPRRKGPPPGTGGRPRKPPEEQRVHVTLRLSPVTMRELDMLAKPGESTAGTIERLVSHYSQAYDPADRP